MNENQVDVGGGVSYRFVTCSHMVGFSGAIVTFETDMPNECEGIITWCSECAASPGRDGPWDLESLKPLHVEPSIQCRAHPQHHGFIRGDKWEQA